MLVQRLTMLPIECVVRGYLAGSGWKDYQATGAVCGHALPSGLREADRLPDADLHAGHEGHRGPRHQHRPGRPRTLLIGEERFAEIEELSLARLRTRGAALRPAARHHPGRHQVRVRHRPDGELVLGDEVLTPDSSRFWPADGYAPGGPSRRFDKQYVRDWLETLDWDKTPPGPELPAEVVEGTQRRATSRPTSGSPASRSGLPGRMGVA